MPLPTLSKIFSFPSDFLSLLGKKKRISAIIAPRSAGKSTAGIIPTILRMQASNPSSPAFSAPSTNLTQIFKTPIGVSVKQVQTPHGNLNIVSSSQYNALLGQKLQQHKQQLQNALFFGSAATPPVFPNPTTMQNLYPSGSPFFSAIRGMKGNTSRPTHAWIDDIDEDYVNLNDPEYYTDDEIIPHDLTGYQQIEPE